MIAFLVNKLAGPRGQNTPMVTILAFGPSCRGLDFQTSPPKKKLEKTIVAPTEVNQGCCLEDSEQWLETVDQIHLVLASRN